MMKIINLLPTSRYWLLLAVLCTFSMRTYAQAPDLSGVPDKVDICLGSCTGFDFPTLPEGHFQTQHYYYLSSNFGQTDWHISGCLDYYSDALTPGTHIITYTATDKGLTSTANCTVTVRQPYTLTIPCSTMSVCKPSGSGSHSLALDATIEGASVVSYTILSGPSGGSMSGNTLYYTATGTYTISADVGHCSTGIKTVVILDCDATDHASGKTDLSDYGGTSPTDPITVGGSSPWYIDGDDIVLTSGNYYIPGNLYLRAVTVSGVTYTNFSLLAGSNFVIDGPEGICNTAITGHSIYVGPDVKLVITDNISFSPRFENHYWGGIMNEPDVSRTWEYELKCNAWGDPYTPISITGSMDGFGATDPTVYGPVYIIWVNFYKCRKGVYTGNVDPSTAGSGTQSSIDECAFFSGYGGNATTGTTTNSESFLTMGTGPVEIGSCTTQAANNNSVNVAVKCYADNRAGDALTTGSNLFYADDVAVDLKHTSYSTYGGDAYYAQNIGMNLHNCDVDISSGAIISVWGVGGIGVNLVNSNFRFESSEIDGQDYCIKSDGTNTIRLISAALNVNSSGGTGLQTNGGSIDMSSNSSISANGGTGIFASGLSSVSVTSNTSTGIYGGANGLVLSACSSLTITNNTISADNSGIEIDGCHYSTISSNTITSGTCITLVGDGTSTVSANTINLGSTGLSIGNNTGGGSAETQNLTLNCNVFTPDPAATTAYGLYVSGTYTKVNDIGGDGTVSTGYKLPSGNIWPITTSSRSNTFTQTSTPSTGWNSPSGWYSIYNVGAPTFKYYAYDNEYMGNKSSSGVTIPSPVGKTAATSYYATACTSGCVIVCDGNLTDDTKFFGNMRFTSPDTGKSVTGVISQSESLLLGEFVPNPTNSQSGISYSLPENTKKAKIQVYESATGRLNFEYILEKREGVQTVNTELLPPGLYVVRLQADGVNMGTKKLVVIK